MFVGGVQHTHYSIMVRMYHRESIDRHHSCGRSTVIDNDGLYMKPDSLVGHDDTNAGLDDDPIAHRNEWVPHTIGTGRWSCRVHGRRTIGIACDPVMAPGDVVRGLAANGLI